MEATSKTNGVVLEFNVRRGFGYIQPEDGDENEKIYVHWKDINTPSRWPQLNPGQKVEFETREEDGKTKAVDVCLPGGTHIGDKDFNLDTTYTGRVKFYDPKKGFGFITPDEPIEWKGISVKIEDGLYVAREEIITDEENPTLVEDEKVEFFVYNGSKGLGAGKVSLPGGHKIQGINRKRRGSFTPVVPDRPYSASNERYLNSRAPFKRARVNPGVVNEKIEIGLHVENKFIGGLIGKGGKMAEQLRTASGAFIKFGEERLGRGPEARRVLSVVGTEKAVGKACGLVAGKIAEVSLSGGGGENEPLELKLTFLIPADYCGHFIGKGGSYLKKVRDAGVQVKVSDDPFDLPGASWGGGFRTATVFGDSKYVPEAIRRIVPKLGHISKRVKEDAINMSTMPWPGGNGGPGW